MTLDPGLLAGLAYLALVVACSAALNLHHLGRRRRRGSVMGGLDFSDPITVTVHIRRDGRHDQLHVELTSTPATTVESHNGTYDAAEAVHQIGQAITDAVTDQFGVGYAIYPEAVTA